MNDFELLSPEERIGLSLRALYNNYGYKQYRMSKFEEYDLYAKNKDFLISDELITFNDTDGRLMALKPDVTLSIVRSMKDTGSTLQKVYYNENVYRVSHTSHLFSEIMQVGLEAIGTVDDATVGEVLTLAMKSLAMLSKDFTLSVSHLGIIVSALEALNVPETFEAEILTAIGEKNMPALGKVLSDAEVPKEKAEALKKLAMLSGAPREVLPELKALITDEEAIRELEALSALLEKEGFSENLRIDFSVLSDLKYYNGIAFHGFVKGIPESVISGGRYDRLLRNLGKPGRAIGFAVYLDLLERLNDGTSTEEKTWLNVALPKGRLGEKVYSMFEKAGFPCPSIREENRKLIFENEEAGVRYFWVKPSDVAIYVERGAADVGVAGKDILLEYEPDVYELLDMKTGKCRMCVAGKADFVEDPQKTLRIATKFANIAKHYYASLGRDIDIIHLNGSIELAPILGLSDVIVDIVETGTTLKENNLTVRETVADISARLIANKASYAFKKAEIDTLVKELEKLTEEKK